MRRLILAMAAVATLGIALPNLTSQAWAQHGVVVQGGGHGGGMRAHRAQRPAIVNRGHGVNRHGMSSRHGGMGRHAPPRMHRRGH
jgi:hypothetical protein